MFGLLQYILVKLPLRLWSGTSSSEIMPSFADIPTELEIQILERLADDKKALNSMMRVNRAWHMHAISLLWRHASAEDLAKIEPLPRRQYYADMLIKLEVTARQCYHKFKFLLFTTLTEVILDPPVYGQQFPVIRSIRLRPYLQPTLRKIHLERGFLLTEDALDMICLGCPLLEDLKLASQLAFADPDEYLTHWTLNFPKVSRLVLAWKCKHSSSALEHLGEQLPSLEHLEVQYHDLDSWQQGPFRAVFPRLKSLELDCQPYSPDHNFDEDCKKIVADRYLSTLLKLAPKLETFRLGWTSRTNGMNWVWKEMSIAELQELR
ncbi:hypothetical protein KCU64_g5267, partial [Aureobasidium melanogenum]